MAHSLEGQSSPRFLDLSGFGYSGKHAMIDLAREFAGYHVPHFAYEFALFRIQGGVLDLEDALLNDWSPVRSDAAVRRFVRLVRRVGVRKSYTNPRTWFASMGWNYDDRYAHRFLERSAEYVRELVVASWRTNWPFPVADLGDVELFARNIAQRVGRKSAFDFDVYLPAPKDFVGSTKRYIHDVLTSDAPAQTRMVVMHNAFEPFQPQRCFKYFDDVRCIIVDRDPRDIYVQQLTHRPMAVGVSDFIHRFLVFRDAVKRFAIDDRRILRIRFEDLVVRYDEMLPRIYEHLGESSATHIAKRQHFDPAVSIRNVGVWKTYPKPEEIARIKHELSSYCWDGE
jgi:hypothetical protein